MFGSSEEGEQTRIKLKTQQKALTLQQIKNDVSNFGKFCLNSGLKIQFGKPVRFPIIRRARPKDTTPEECFSSRNSNQTESQINLYCEERQILLEQEPMHHDRSSSLLNKTIEKTLSKLNYKDRSLETGVSSPLCEATTESLLPDKSRKTLPKIFKFKCFKGNQRHQRMKSQRQLTGLEEVEGFERYKLSNIIGQGSYATVRLAEDESGTLVAVKTYSKAKLKDNEKRDNLKRQIDILGRVSHPNIMHFIEAIETASTVNIIVQLIRGTSLLDYINSNISTRLDEHEARHIFSQIISALGYLHSQEIAHRDIKLQNILMTKERKVKLIDFGFASDSRTTLQLFCGTPGYIAPEIIARKGYYAKPTDIWACGVLLYRMICGSFPFKGLNEKTLYGKISKGSFRFTVNISMNAQILINRMLTMDPTNRITLEQIQSQPWLLEKS